MPSILKKINNKYKPIATYKKINNSWKRIKRYKKIENIWIPLFGNNYICFDILGYNKVFSRYILYGKNYLPAPNKINNPCEYEFDFKYTPRETSSNLFNLLIFPLCIESGTNNSNQMRIDFLTKDNVSNPNQIEKKNSIRITMIKNGATESFTTSQIEENTRMKVKVIITPDGTISVLKKLNGESDYLEIGNGNLDIYAYFDDNEFGEKSNNTFTGSSSQSDGGFTFYGMHFLGVNSKTFKRQEGIFNLEWDMLSNTILQNASSNTSIPATLENLTVEQEI